VPMKSLGMGVPALSVSVAGCSRLITASTESVSCLGGVFHGWCGIAGVNLGNFWVENILAVVLLVAGPLCAVPYCVRCRCNRV
jgi:hypothetical protein